MLNSVLTGNEIDNDTYYRIVIIAHHLNVKVMWLESTKIRLSCFTFLFRFSLNITRILLYIYSKFSDFLFCLIFFLCLKIFLCLVFLSLRSLISLFFTFLQSRISLSYFTSLFSLLIFLHTLRSLMSLFLHIAPFSLSLVLALSLFVCLWLISLIFF